MLRKLNFFCFTNVKVSYCWNVNIIFCLFVFWIMYCWRPPSLSELTPILFDMESTYLGSEASIYKVFVGYIANNSFKVNYTWFKHLFFSYKKERDRIKKVKLPNCKYTTEFGGFGELIHSPWLPNFYVLLLWILLY